MTLSDALTRPTRAVQILQTTAVILVTGAAVFLTSRNPDVIASGLMLGICIPLAPAAFILTRRAIVKARKRAITERMVLQTRAYLNRLEACPGLPAISDIKHPAGNPQESRLTVTRPALARELEGWLMPAWSFRDLVESAVPAPGKTQPAVSEGIHSQHDKLILPKPRAVLSN